MEKRKKPLNNFDDDDDGDDVFINEIAIDNIGIRFSKGCRIKTARKTCSEILKDKTIKKYLGLQAFKKNSFDSLLYIE